MALSLAGVRATRVMVAYAMRHMLAPRVVVTLVYLAFTVKHAQHALRV